MKIALDYDDTYTADPQLWEDFIKLSKSRGHEVTIVTMRYPEEGIDGLLHPVIFTSRKAKYSYCLEHGGRRFDIWIDDKPHWIFQDG